MIKLRVFSLFSCNFTYTIMSGYTVLKESKQSFYSTKNLLIINLKGKLQKHFCSLKRRIWLAHLFVEIPRGFELPMNKAIQLR